MAPSNGPRDTRRVAESETLRDELRRRREAGEVFVTYVRHERGEDADQAVRELLAAPPTPLKGTSQWDFILEHEGRSADGGLAHLDLIDAETARQLVAHDLRFELAYGAECLDAATAARLARRVIESLPEPVRWWTNGTIGQRSAVDGPT